MRKFLPFLLAAFAAIGADVLTPGLFYRTDTRIVGATNLIFSNQTITNSSISGTAVNLTGSLTNVTVDGVPADSLITGTLLPPVGGTNYWALGDSQTYGQYATSFPWTDGANRLFESLRYPNILAEKYGLNLTNRGISGNRFAYTATATQNGLAQANVIPLDWSGLVTVALGYNDAGSDRYGTPQRTFSLFRSAAGSLIARLHAATWTVGTGLRNDGSTDSSFTTTGTVSDGGNAGHAPFPYGTPASDTRKLLSLEPGDTITFAATNAAVWFQTATDGGSLQLFQGTNYLAAGNGDSDDSATYNLPQVMLANGYSGTFTVTNVSGTNVVLAVGSISEPDVSRTVILAGPLQLGDYTIRSDGTCALIASAVMAAAQDLAAYRVGYADWQERMDTSTMIESSDLSHPNPFGQKAMVAALENAMIPEAIPALGSPSPRWTDRGFQVSGALTSVSQYVQRPGVFLASVSSVGYLDSYNPSTAAYLPLNIRSLRTAIDSGSLQVVSATSSTSDYYVGDSVTLATAGSVGFIDSLNWNGSSVSYLPLNLRAKTTHIASGPLQVSGSGLSVADYATNASVVISETGGIGNIGALHTDGTNATFLPLSVDALTTHIKTGPFQVSGAASAVSQYATNASVVISETGGTGYIDAIYTDGATSTSLPLQLRATTVTVPNSGGLAVGSGAGNRGIAINSGSGSISYIDLQSASTIDWRIEKGSVASGLNFIRYSGGSPVDSPLSISLTTGLTTLTSANVTGTLTASSAIELGHATDTTLARSAAGKITVEGVPVALAPLVTTLSYSGSDVTVVAGKGPLQRSQLTAAGNFNLLFTGGAQNDGGTIYVAPAATNCTVTLPSYAFGPSGTTLTITGGTGNTNFTKIAWEIDVIGGTNRVAVNAINYYR